MRVGVNGLPFQECMFKPGCFPEFCRSMECKSIVRYTMKFMSKQILFILLFFSSLHAFGSRMCFSHLEEYNGVGEAHPKKMTLLLQSVRVALVLQLSFLFSLNTNQKLLYQQFSLHSKLRILCMCRA